MNQTINFLEENEGGKYINTPGINKVKFSSVQYLEEPSNSGEVFKKLSIVIEDEHGASLGKYGWQIRMIEPDMEEKWKQALVRQIVAVAKCFLNVDQLKELSTINGYEPMYKRLAEMLANITDNTWLAMKLVYNKRGYLEPSGSGVAFLAKWDDHVASLSPDGVSSKLVYVNEQYDRVVPPPKADDESAMDQAEQTKTPTVNQAPSGMPFSY